MELLEEKKNKNKKYEPILHGIPDWPVYQLSKNRKEFVELVTRQAIERIKILRPSRKQLIDELEATAYREQNRIKRNRWRVDPKDDSRFWSYIKNELVSLSAKNAETTSATEDALLEKIVHRYANEIAGNFKPNSYRVTREVVKFWFQRLLNGARVKKFGAFFRNQYTLRDKIHVVGKVKMLRSLAKKGTVVMVPTHFSNLDSILIGWVIHSVGLPAFIYGAGLNLFNIKIFAYFMNSLGAYKVDRRKKNLPYLETLKMYSSLAIQKGAHSLFFPGGTRSRSGLVEKQLKLGLLSTAIEAQRNLYQETPEGEVRKIFVVPVTLNYNFVLEAPDLIEDYLQVKGQDKYFPEQDKYGSMELLRFMFKFFTKGSNISVSIGPGLDVMGNYVDDEGNSLDAQGRVIDTRGYFISNGSITDDKQREDEYTRMLSQRIVTEYHRINRVFASHLAAFVAFEMWQKKYAKLDLFNLLRLPEEDLELDYEEFRATFKRVRKKIYELKDQNKVYHATHLKGKVDQVIKLGIENVGIFHLKRPLLKNKKGNIITKDLTVLYYYHNRLVGYDLEQYI
ncbi:MAG TPA: 1-acyl-sn-glycerol-3-phosphate acyltransferase [Cyclobacteriaceae bacterium]|jgi:glycerol-3-phosphate O-acyltransferase|nr:1-acyl-sn-glycerol-3-phosphate acyltransferase [Cytophagales bacterium]HRE66330.1 1-acyl-sn-glycerol-3-phosphate acyltransferase [Cyclobacteriaceae bacterium]HRF32848.1 1-acyl-sn-glycerol-3-phosphate acyltransferase [Cyclobacteriaceae bacterium]